MKTADICDAHPEVEILAAEFIDFGALNEFHGKVTTIAAFEDNSRVREAVAEAGEGRVLVIDGGGSMRHAMLGGNLGVEAARNGWAGIVINGAVRDSHELFECEIGIRALGSCPRKTEKRGEGQRDVVVGVGALRIQPGSWLYADEDGMVLSSHEIKLDQ